jgi:uncharacterized protein
MRALFLSLLFLLLHATTACASVLLPTAITRADGSQVTLRLETARDDESREQGLMYRKTLAPADGMAFFFPKPAPYKFWMKNTLIPLDMLFVDEACRIVYIHTAKPLSLTPVGPETPVTTVIEIAGGRAKREGIHVGDRVRYETEMHSGCVAR